MTNSKTLNVVFYAAGAVFWLAMLTYFLGGFTWQVPAATLFVAVCVLIVLANVLPTLDETFHRRHNVCFDLRVERLRLKDKLDSSRKHLASCQSDTALPALPADLQVVVAERLAAAQAEVSRLEWQLECVEAALPQADSRLDAIRAEIQTVNRRWDDLRLGRLCARA